MNPNHAPKGPGGGQFCAGNSLHVANGNYMTGHEVNAAGGPSKIKGYSHMVSPGTPDKGSKGGHEAVTMARIGGNGLSPGQRVPAAKPVRPSVLSGPAMSTFHDVMNPGKGGPVGKTYSAASAAKLDHNGSAHMTAQNRASRAETVAANKPTAQATAPHISAGKADPKTGSMHPPKAVAAGHGAPGMPSGPTSPAAIAHQAGATPEAGLSRHNVRVSAGAGGSSTTTVMARDHAHAREMVQSHEDKWNAAHPDRHQAKVLEVLNEKEVSAALKTKQGILDRNYRNAKKQGW